MDGIFPLDLKKVSALITPALSRRYFCEWRSIRAGVMYRTTIALPGPIYSNEQGSFMSQSFSIGF